MSVWLHSDGTRDRSYRPYIEKEEQANSIPLYDPNISFNYGLYTQAQPSCGTWLDMWDQYPENRRPPIRSIDRRGQYFYKGNLYKGHESITQHILQRNVPRCGDRSVRYY
ncbi:MAG TPA: hypothetical protein VLE02_01895 [Nitrosarchaeum sp.]|nr:hypothetical protein [Nitrosarchaeum sp.]